MSAGSEFILKFSLGGKVLEFGDVVLETVIGSSVYTG